MYTVPSVLANSFSSWEAREGVLGPQQYHICQPSNENLSVSLRSSVELVYWFVKSLPEVLASSFDYMSFFTRVRELLHSPTTTSVTSFTNSSNYSDDADALFIFAIAMLLVNIRFAHAWVPILEWVLINAMPNIHRMPTFMVRHLYRNP